MKDNYISYKIIITTISRFDYLNKLIFSLYILCITFLAYLLSVNEPCYNVRFIQSDDDSDTSFFTENTEQMLQKNLGLNGGVFSETESDDDHQHNHTVSLCKQVEYQMSM